MELIINSPKYGEIKYLIDGEYYDKVKSYNWHAYYSPNTKSFYISTNIRKNNGKYTLLRLHRLITDAPKGMCIDHINHNTLDNRKTNLRICTNAENQRNSRKHFDGITSKYKGVSWKKHAKKFVAKIRYCGKDKHLGYFDNELDAAIAYNNAAIKYYGEYAKLNEVNVW